MILKTIEIMKKLIFLLLLALPFFGFSQAAYLMEFTNPNGSKVVFNLNDVRSCVAEGTGSFLFVKTGSGKVQVQESPSTISMNSCGNIVLFTVYLPSNQMNDTKQMGVNPNFVVGVVSNTSGNGVLKMVSPTENFTTTGTYDAAVTALSICVSGGGGGGSLTNTYVGFGDGLNQLDGEAGFTYDAESNRLAVDTVKTKRITAKVSPLEILGDIKELDYPNTRNDAGLPVNILSTSAAGVQESHPISEIGDFIDSCNSTRITSFTMGADIVNTAPGYADMDGVMSFYNDNGRLINVGGWKGVGLHHNEVWYSDNNGLTWTQAANAAFSARHAFGYARQGGFFYIVGGDQYDVPGQTEVWKSATTDGLTWTLVTASAAFGVRIGGGVASDGTNLYLFGGQASLASTTPLQDAWKSTDNGVTWTNICTSCGKPSGYNWNMVKYWKGKFWWVGGVNNATNTYFKTVWSSSDGITWTVHPDLPIVDGISFSNIFVKDNQLWLYGGYSPTLTNTNYLYYTEDGQTWHNQTTDEIRAAHAASLAVKPDNTGFIITAGFENDIYDVYQRVTSISKYRDCAVVESLTTDNSKLPAIPLNQLAFGTTTGLTSSSKFVVSGNDINLSTGDVKARNFKSSYDNAVLAGTDVGGTYIGLSATAQPLYLGAANNAIRMYTASTERLNISNTGLIKATAYGSGTFATGLSGYVPLMQAGGNMFEIAATTLITSLPSFEIGYGTGAGTMLASNANIKTNANGDVRLNSATSNGVYDNTGNSLVYKDASLYSLFGGGGFSATTTPIYIGQNNSSVNVFAANSAKLILASTGVKMPTLATKSAAHPKLMFWASANGEVANGDFIAVGSSPNANAATISPSGISLELATTSFPGVMSAADKTKLDAAITTLAAVGSTPNANAATLSGSTLNLEPASATHKGVIGLNQLKFPMKIQVVDGNTDVPGAGLQTYEVIRIPAAYDGYSISDVSYGVYKTGATGTAEMQIRKNGSGTAGVTWTAGQGVKDVTLTGVTVSTGDLIDVEIISNSMATPQQGLWVTIFLTPH